MSASISGSELRITLTNYNNTSYVNDWTVTVAPSANFIWNEDTPNYNSKSYVLRITKKNVDLPRLIVEEGDTTVVGNTRTVKYDGTAKMLEFAPADSTYISTNAAAKGMTEDWTSVEDTLRLWAINANTYEITLSIKNAYFYQWKGGVANPTYYLIIEKEKIKVPVFTQETKGQDEEGNDTNISTPCLLYTSPSPRDP